MDSTLDSAKKLDTGPELEHEADGEQPNAVGNAENGVAEVENPSPEAAHGDHGNAEVGTSRDGKQKVIDATADSAMDVDPGPEGKEEPNIQDGGAPNGQDKGESDPTTRRNMKRFSEAPQLQSPAKRLRRCQSEPLRPSTPHEAEPEPVEAGVQEPEQKSVNLAEYIHRAYPSTSQDRIFQHKHLNPLNRPPRLVSGRCNRILVYPGCFNPPHIGHMRLLKHVFWNSGEDLNLIATIILPGSDITRKDGNDPEAVHLPLADRVRLWHGHAGSDWFWVYDRGITNFAGFKEDLKSAIVKDGFEVEFVVLFGADHIRTDKKPQPAFEGKTILVSDAGRPAGFINPSAGSLEILKGCGPWGEVSPDYELLRERADENAHWLYATMCTQDECRAGRLMEYSPERVGRLAEDLFKEAVDKISAVRVCHLEKDPEVVVRYIPSGHDYGALNHGIPWGVCSTSIRAVIKKTKHDKDHLLKSLESIVLHPDLLIEMI